MAAGHDLREAFYRAMCQRGTAAVFTALTMSLGVCTWVFAPLKFQADMGVLLSFMFLVNVLGAIFLLPALAAWFNLGGDVGRCGFRGGGRGVRCAPWIRPRWPKPLGSMG